MDKVQNRDKFRVLTYSQTQILSAKDKADYWEELKPRWSLSSATDFNGVKPVRRSWQGKVILIEGVISPKRLSKGDSMIMINYRHDQLISRLEEIRALPIDERIGFYEAEIMALDQAFAIFEWTGVFDLRSPSEGVIRYGRDTPLEELKALRKVLVQELKFAEMQQPLKNGNYDTLSEEDKAKFKLATKKIALLHEFGLLDIIMEKSKSGDTLNTTRASNILEPIMDIKAETIRKTLDAIYRPNEGNSKNNPLYNPETQALIQSMKANLKIK